MLDSLLSMFKKEKSGKVAKKRLQMVLIQDRASVSPEVMEKLRDDIIQVISKYMVINKSDMEISLENVEDSVALVANIPVQNMRHH
ncbi:MAG: cell division topological specificity factor MinE [Veillonellaceae bacterium]|uniref:cell division topological specificity factor MinE n=1 Tax=Anaerovibrio lipolyticus TaxID=82374 RepID=UPI001F2DD65D|nr:cell division topological specificity factor MinE [Anaerovibrio lipolyticus]MCI6910217.1 cell division topological specificity factor MinE [Veillonellaceae bacterium]MDY4485210.1 cell division topological specificity factor MinE [Anaerovibrio sp.]MCF2601774.1 cell division topological specificity factor MinE [Anaerovibrio lipolyticus]MCI7077707.1 cell division topological specificity factor MinE [Veillonellaceae bacterium]MCI7236046.1 cell division topological specificity factor MinE [Veill